MHPSRTSPRHRVLERLGGLRPVVPDLRALRLWALTRVVVFLVAGCAGWLFADGSRKEPEPFVDRWARWDWDYFQEIAEYGYDGDPRKDSPLEAFFPGFPAVVRVVHEVVPSWTLAGLLISLLAGAVAVVALARLGDQVDLPASTGERAVLLLLLAPPAVFLAAGYTEALFLAVALPAWLAARRGDWLIAGMLAAGAATVRISGVFLAVALAVEFLTARDGRRRWRELGWLALPAVPPLFFLVHLHERTGDWLAWLHIQEKHWDRGLTSPVEALDNTWAAAFGGGQDVGYAWMFRVELLAVLALVVLTGWLVARRRWGEGTWAALQLIALATSYWYLSVPRTLLLCWPLWLGLAAWSLRRPAVLTGYLVVVAPFTVVFTLLFTTGRYLV